MGLPSNIIHIAGKKSLPNLYSNELNSGSTNESVSVADDAILKPSGDHSVSYWLKTSSGATQVLFEKLTSITGTGSGVFTNKATAYVGNGVAALTLISSTSNVNTGNWVHVCYTYIGTTLRLYINGTQEASNISASYAPSSAALSIGIRGASFPATAKIAHPAMFNAGLTLAQVNEVMNKKMGDLRTTSVAANLIGAWHFPNGQTDFPTLTDYSGNGNNGTMQNQENTDINTDIPT